MVLEILSQIYFNNTILAWVYFFATIIIFIVIAKAILYFSKGFGRRITTKTKGTFDDLVIDMLEEPIVFIVIIFGLFVGYQFLTFPEEVNVSFQNILSLLGVIAGTWIGIRIIDALLEQAIKPLTGKTRTTFDDQLIPILKKTLKAVLILLAIIMTLENFGIDVFTFIAGLGIGGLAFAFAAKETIADAFGGISILMSRPFSVGETIEFGGVTGTVEEISIRHTRLRNFDKRLVIVPNSKIATSIVTNITSAPKRKVVWKIGVTYNTSISKIEKAKKIIEKAILSCDSCEKAPTVAFDEFAESSLNINVVFFTKTSAWADLVKAKDEVGLKIKKEFEKNKIEFAFPTQTIYVKK